MNHRQRFRALMNYEPIDRMPLYYFGTWPETKVRWKQEGLPHIEVLGSGGPQLPEMDPDWEDGMWSAHGLVNVNPISPHPQEILEETDDYRVVRTPLGAVLKESKGGSSIEHHIEEALQPTRASWERFKSFIDPDTPERRPSDWEENADALNQRETLTPFCVGSLFGWTRNWMGVEQLTYLSYDDPLLYEEIIDYLTEYYITIEVGTWQSDPTVMRRQYGKKLRMVGGIDKHVIPQGEAAIRRHLEHLKPLAAEGGGQPLPLQIRTMLTWPDGSVKWVLLDFQTDLKSGEKNSCRLFYGDGVETAPLEKGIAVNQDEDSLPISTDSLSFAVSSTGATSFDLPPASTPGPATPL